MKRLSLWLALLALALSGQTTRTSVSDLRSPAVPAFRIWISIPGQTLLSAVQTDSSLVLDTSTSPATLKAVLPTVSAPSYVEETSIVTVANQAITLSTPPLNAFGAYHGLRVYKNGLLMAAGAANDYTFAGSAITFTATAGDVQGLKVGDRVTAQYFR